MRNTIVADHYGNVPESPLSGPIAGYVRRSAPYGEMVSRVVTGTSSVADVYEWGRRQLRRALEVVRSRVRERGD